MVMPGLLAINSKILLETLRTKFVSFPLIPGRDI